MCLFLRLSQQLRPRASSALCSYIDDLAYGIKGNIEWSLQVPRYDTLWASDSARKLVRIAFTCGWEDHPSAEQGPPPEIPSIAWWRDQLA